MGAPLLSSSSRRDTPLRVAFCHPDLGLGGAERLIVDAAVELAQRGHDVTIYTAHHDPSRAFAETVDGPFRVVVAGSWFPRSLLGGRAIALCAYVRCILAALRIAWDGRGGNRGGAGGGRWDVVIADQVSAVVPFLHFFTSAAVLFYCHFPDLLLAKPRAPGSLSSRIHKLYRAPLDAIEQASTGAADALLVNSEFTAGVFATTFSKLDRRGIKPRVLYPAASIPSEDELERARGSWREVLPPEIVSLVEGGAAGGVKATTTKKKPSSLPLPPSAVFVSINRFEGKKGLPLALLALHELGKIISEGEGEQGKRSALRRRGGDSSSFSSFSPPVLVFAGGYDPRLPENEHVLSSLKALARELNLSHRVAFLPSFSDAQRGALLSVATAVVYTPENEHFGIVPVEAGAAGVPVVACDSGGPRESVLDGETGFLRDADPLEFARAMRRLLPRVSSGSGAKSDESVSLSRTMGQAARLRASAVFSRSAFGRRLEQEVRSLVEAKEEKEGGERSEKDESKKTKKRR